MGGILTRRILAGRTGLFKLRTLALEGPLRSDLWKTLMFHHRAASTTPYQGVEKDPAGFINQISIAAAFVSEPGAGLENNSGFNCCQPNHRYCADH
jgi:hypothetical protein